MLYIVFVNNAPRRARYPRQFAQAVRAACCLKLPSGSRLVSGGRRGAHRAVTGRRAAAHRGLRRSAAGPRPRRHLAGSLTDREAQVLACLGEGLSNAQIAARLYLSKARVKGHVSRMLDKLGCANRAQA